MSQDSCLGRLMLVAWTAVKRCSSRTFGRLDVNFKMQLALRHKCPAMQQCMAAVSPALPLPLLGIIPHPEWGREAQGYKV